jgi:regulator of sigma E protease
MTTLPIGESMWRGLVTTMQQIALIVQLPYLLFVGDLQPSDAQLSGPVGIAQLVGEAVNATMDTGFWFPIWQLSAALSAALAITNLLPLPALDGGRLLFIFIETLRGRRINPEREGLVHMVGFMLLLGLMIYITVQDIRSGGVSIDWHTLLGQ